MKNKNKAPKLPRFKAPKLMISKVYKTKIQKANSRRELNKIEED